MAGKAGTVRFGVNPDIHIDGVGPNGIGYLKTPIDGPWTETHFSYNPATYSRDMGSTRGGDPGKDFVHTDRQVDYMSNHDSYLGGDAHLMSLDERKALNNTIYSVKCEYEWNSSNGTAPHGTTGAFD